MRNKRNERYEIYTKVFELLLMKEIDDTVAPLEKICELYGIVLIPLSAIIKATGLKEKDVFALWGNKDGCINLLRKNDKIQLKISFNDKFTFNNQRYRFTIAEEIMHYVLGHYKYKMYYSNFPELWDEDLYQKHDEAARIAAGFLLCPPPLVYETPADIKEPFIENFCELSRPCVKARIGITNTYMDEIKSHPLYSDLLEKYNHYIEKILCPFCGFGFMFSEVKPCPECFSRIVDNFSAFV